MVVKWNFLRNFVSSLCTSIHLFKEVLRLCNYLV